MIRKPFRRLLVCRAREAGSVTLETAMALPALIVVVVLLAWGLSIGVAQVRSIDVARDVARSLARGDDQTAVLERAQHAMGGEGSIEVFGSGDEIRVEVLWMARLEWPLLPDLPAVDVGAQASIPKESR